MLVSAIAGMIVASGKGMDIVGAYSALACVKRVRRRHGARPPPRQPSLLLDAALGCQSARVGDPRDLHPFVYSPPTFRLGIGGPPPLGEGGGCRRPGALHHRRRGRRARAWITAPRGRLDGGGHRDHGRRHARRGGERDARPLPARALYATASFTGALAFIAALENALRYTYAAGVGVVSIVVLRLLSVRLGVKVPAAHWHVEP